MTGERLRLARKDAGWTQARLGRRLGVAQAYVSLMEKGRRRVPDHLAAKLTSLLHLPATALPFPTSSAVGDELTNPRVADELTKLGYPALAYRPSTGEPRNPAWLLLGALGLDALEARLVEALPWLLLAYGEFDRETLVARAKEKNLQNRLGFTVALARTVAEHNPTFHERVDELRMMEDALERSRLAREDTLGRDETSERMRAWIRQNRSDAAKHWNLLTDLRAEHLPYGGHDPGAVA